MVFFWNIYIICSLLSRKYKFFIWRLIINNSSNLRLLLICIFIGFFNLFSSIFWYLFIFFFKRILFCGKVFKSYEMFLDVVID